MTQASTTSRIASYGPVTHRARWGIGLTGPVWHHVGLNEPYGLLLLHLFASAPNAFPPWDAYMIASLAQPRLSRAAGECKANSQTAQSITKGPNGAKTGHK